MRYVLDTNILIYYFKGQGCVAQHLLGTPPSNLAIPTVVLFELLLGIAKSNSPQKRLQQLENLIAKVTLIPFGMVEAKAAATLRAELEQAGTPIGPIDVLIAGTALAHDATLVTHNVKEFSRIRALKFVDWYEKAESEDKGSQSK